MRCLAAGPNENQNLEEPETSVPYGRHDCHAVVCGQVKFCCLALHPKPLEANLLA